jgi:hypothetical protein
MTQKMFVSDAGLVIDLLKKYDSLGGYLQFCPERFLPEDAKGYLTRNGESFEEALIVEISKVFDSFGLEYERFAPDILFLVKVFQTTYSTAKSLRLRGYGSRVFNHFGELKILDELLNQNLDDNVKRISQIQLKFKRGRKNHSIKIESSQTIEYLENKLREFLLLDANQRGLLTDDEYLRNYYLQYGKISKNKDTAKLIIRLKFCLILREYLSIKQLLGMGKSINVLTNSGAHLIGRFLGIMGLIDHTPDQFVKDKNLILSYASYEYYLTQKVKSYLSTGKKSMK